MLTRDVDLALLGRLGSASQNDSRLGAFLVAFMDTMCAYMLAVAILQLAVVWFALRRRQQWALWTAVIADLAIIPYYAAIMLTYTGFGVPIADLVPGFGGLAIRLLVAIIYAVLG